MGEIQIFFAFVKLSCTEGEKVDGGNGGGDIWKHEGGLGDVEWEQSP
jgi:hypothetical protein